MSNESPPESTDVDQEFARLRLEGMGPLGDTRAQYEGDPIDVFGGIPGEEVLARIFRYKRRRQQHVSGVVKEVLKPSPHRVSPPCPYFGPCSGCQWQHIEYSHQLRLKREAVQSQLEIYAELKTVPRRGDRAKSPAVQLPEPRPLHGTRPGLTGFRQPYISRFRQDR